MIYKFVKWDVDPIKSLAKEPVYKLHAKYAKGKPLTREDKDFLFNGMRSSMSFYGIKRGGYIFDFSAILHGYYVEQYGTPYKVYAPDKTSIRRNWSGRITRITEFK